MISASLAPCAAAPAIRCCLPGVAVSGGPAHQTGIPVTKGCFMCNWPWEGSVRGTQPLTEGAAQCLKG